MYPGECSLCIWDEDNFSAVRWCYIYLVYSVVQILFPYWSCLISLSTVENTVLNSLNIMFCYKFLPLLLFSCSVMSSSLLLCELQHARLSCPLLSPGFCSNSCPLSQWCYLTISPSGTPFSSCSQSFPASGSFSMSQLFTSGGQSTGVSASTWVLPMNTQD